MPTLHGTETGGPFDKYGTFHGTNMGHAAKHTHHTDHTDHTGTDHTGRCVIPGFGDRKSTIRIETYLGCQKFGFGSQAVCQSPQATTRKAIWFGLGLGNGVSMVTQ